MASLKGTVLVVATAFVCAFAAVGIASAQTANFTFDDMNGPGDAGFYPAGASFTMSINLSFAPGGTISNLEGLSYWFEQPSPLPPFYFAITNRDLTGSQFTSLAGNPTYPQNLAPSNTDDLGALLPGPTGLGAGNYFIANITFSISPSAAPGTYIIESTT